MKRQGSRCHDPGPRDRDPARLQRRPQRLQGVAAELAELVEEEHAAVGQGRLSGPRRVAAADQAGRADRVVRRAEGPACPERAPPAGRRRWRSAPPPAPPPAPAAAGSRAAGSRPATSRRRAARSSAGCGRRPPRPRARGAGGAGRAGRRGPAPPLSGSSRQRQRLPAAGGAHSPRRQRRAAGPARRAGSRRSAATSAASGPFSAGTTIAPAPSCARGLGDRQRAGDRPDRAVERQLADHRRRAQSAFHSSWPEAVSSALAIARSIPGPALRRLAGARLATIRRSGNSKPQLASAARTRSRASRTAASGRPTTEKAGRPRWTSTSTRTGRAEMPSRVKVSGGGEHRGRR